MNAPVEIPDVVRAPRFDAKVLASCRLAAHAILVLGRYDGCLPARGTISDRPGLRPGQFQCAIWLDGGLPVPNCFIVGLGVALGERLDDGTTLSLTGVGRSDGVGLALPHATLEPSAFGALLAREAGVQAVLVCRFLLQMIPPTARASPVVRALFTAFLGAAAPMDGCVELVGRLAPDTIVLQGWGLRAAEEIVLLEAAPGLLPVRNARFARDDIQGPATGQVIFIADVPAGFVLPERVVLRHRDALVSRPILPDHRLMRDDETVGAMRDMMLRLDCDAPTAEWVRATLCPRFNGTDTLNSASSAVRAAIDRAFVAPGAGLLLAGWLYDPSRRMTQIHVRGSASQAVRLDTIWTRVARPDVTEAFRSDSSLPAWQGPGDAHGFVARVPWDEGSEELCLDVVFDDGVCGFLPLPAAPLPAGLPPDTLLDCADLTKTSGPEIVVRHLAPFVSGARHAKLPKAQLDRPPPAKLDTLIVVPVGDTMPPPSFLSQFQHDPMGADEAVLFVASGELADAAALRAQARFYGVTATIATVDRPVTAATACCVAAHLTDAPRLLVLDPAAIGAAPGWRAILHAVATRAGGTVCVSPILLHEDDSIAYAGVAAIDPAPDDAWPRVVRPWHGMAGSIVATDDPEPTLAATLACCLLPRVAALRHANITDFATRPGADLDLFARFAAAGVPSWRAPAARVYITHAATPDSNRARVAKMIDGWRLRDSLERMA